MEVLVTNRLAMEKKEVSCESDKKVCNFVDLDGGGSGASSLCPDEMTINGENCSYADSSSPTSMIWSLNKEEKASHCVSSQGLEQVDILHSDNSKEVEKQEPSISDLELMKERFSKLLLGEDMSGCGNGVSTALAISNAITNLCATVFGQVWRLEPLQHEKKLLWRREMDWLLCVSNFIVELVPCWQTFPDGSKLEIMTSKPRSDLAINLPALRKLDHMLLEILDRFENSEFWYVDQGIVVPDSDESSSLRKPLPRQEDKWWLPVPRIPPGGLSGNARKILQHRRDCANQILKAAMAINNAALAEMDVPDSFIEALPKNAKESLGDLIHRYINSDQFSAEFLLNFLDVSSDDHALEITNRLESAIHVWRRKTISKPITHSTQRPNSKSSWEIVKEFMFDGDKIEQLAEKAESLLLHLKHKFPGLPQTTLDASKIQHNKDVGKSILESYSRALESLAFNIVARLDDLLYVDDLSMHSDQLLSFSKFSMKHQSSSSIIQELKPVYVEDQKNFLTKKSCMDDLSDEGKSKAVSSSSTGSFDFRSSIITREIAASPAFESCSYSGEA